MFSPRYRRNCDTVWSRGRIKEEKLNRAKRLNCLNHLNSPVLARRNWSWAGKLFIKLYALRIPRQVANRLLVCFGRQWTRIVTNQFMVFLEERRILKTLANGFFDDSTRSLGMAGGRMKGEPVKLKLRNIVTILRSRSVLAKPSISGK